MILKSQRRPWNSDFGTEFLFLAFLLALIIPRHAESAREPLKNDPESTNFEVPEINFDEWLQNEQPFCGSKSSAIKWQRAAEDILNFTVVFKHLYSVRFATLEFDQLRKYSYTINKSADFLNKFPKFVKKLLPNLTTMDDICFMENAMDIFSVLEQWRYFLQEQMYSHIEDLSKNAQNSFMKSPFHALLFGFRKHITNERQFLKQFLWSVMEARVDNMLIPSRYSEGSLPGLDHLMQDLNVSSPLEELGDEFYRISIPGSEESCLSQEIGTNKVKIQNSEGAKSCLLFRFVKSQNKNDYTLQVQGRPDILKLKNTENFEAILLNPELLATQSEDYYNQFRLLRLSNGNVWIVCKTDTKPLFIKRTKHGEKIYGKEPLCNSSIDKLLEWRIERVD